MRPHLTLIACLLLDCIRRRSWDQFQWRHRSGRHQHNTRTMSTIMYVESVQITSYRRFLIQGDRSHFKVTLQGHPSRSFRFLSQKPLSPDKWKITSWMRAITFSIVQQRLCVFLLLCWRLSKEATNPPNGSLIAMWLDHQLVTSFVVLFRPFSDISCCDERRAKRLSQAQTRAPALFNNVKMLCNIIHNRFCGASI